jgi:hypothetical protein
MVEGDDFSCGWRVDADTDYTCASPPAGDPIYKQGDVLVIELEEPILQLACGVRSKHFVR